MWTPATCGAEENGTCGYCNTMTATFLPEGTALTVVPPKNAKANNSKAIDYTKIYTGTSNAPKISPQYKGRYKICLLNILLEKRNVIISMS
jgi:hypothetical protein